ncbi:bifunctional riboflavin kinase/FAD synthetase [Phycicoccus sp. Root101]|uniref:bifunctional riboflavin kinase/FAD synthetase n=1 Tax=Phycicoccus sp. Root101 TaxID=1736421 RepID=UPI00070252A3|nr:bifunctional riboflavin kinase/FAD synthetase [Phycicoccus sp. Root101]KQU71010.1 bifunctional riboflavin kinase/FMN adenylyltransferase [Phycicoccus sp. Root101]
MHRWTDPAQTPDSLRRSVATFGNFDGVHLGHRAVLSRLVEEGTRRGLPSVAVTFDPHPAEIFHPEGGLELIAPGRLRDELLAETGLDGLLVLDFTREFAEQTAEEFIVRTFVDTLGVAALVVGADARGFGRGYTGDVGTLRELGATHGFDVVVLDDLGEGERWSSSAVRRHLAAGEVAAAAGILGRPHRMTGTVVHGAHRGRELGYPTANLSDDSLGLVPADGVYAGWLTRTGLATQDPERTLPCAVSVGTNPTFDGTVRTVEAYVLDRTDLDLYDEQVTVEFVEHIRPTLRFESIEELLEAMAGDIEKCRQVLASIVPS